MNKQKTVVIGVVSGLLCALCVFVYTQSVQGEASAARAEALARYGGEQLEVCVASRDIAPGEKVDSSNVVTKLWVADLLPLDAIRSVADVAGKQATSSILAGEVVSNKRFDAEASAIEVPAGMSALSVPAKDVQSVGGSIIPGMLVDVYVTGDSATNLLLQNVLVLSTSITEPDKKSGTAVAWVTLAVEPDSVQEVIAASQKAQLYFALPSSIEKGSS